MRAVVLELVVVLVLESGRGVAGVDLYCYTQRGVDSYSQAEVLGVGRGEPDRVKPRASSSLGVQRLTLSAFLIKVQPSRKPRHSQQKEGHGPEAEPVRIVEPVELGHLLARAEG